MKKKTTKVRPLTTKLEVHWPDYDTNFTFRVKCNGKYLWSDNNRMPMSLRLLLAAAIRNLDRRSTLGETVIEAAEGEIA